MEDAEVGEVGHEDDMSLEEALQPPSRGGSPFPLGDVGGHGHSKYTYSVSLRSEPKVCRVFRFLEAVAQLSIIDQPF